MNFLTAINKTQQRYLKAAAASQIVGKKKLRRPTWVRGTDGSTISKTGNGLNAFFLPWPAENLKR